MSANNVVWLMRYMGYWHVFYSGCFDNTPKEPDYKDEYYNSFKKKSIASIYAHAVVEDLDTECIEEGYIGVEYGVCEVPQVFIDCRGGKYYKDIVKAVKENEERITKLEKRDCSECVLYGECDHLGAYKEKNGKWCYEDVAEPSKCNDGCYQFTYCNECLAYPMGMGCPNIVKGPIRVKIK